MPSIIAQLTVNNINCTIKLQIYFHTGCQKIVPCKKKKKNITNDSTISHYDIHFSSLSCYLCWKEVPFASLSFWLFCSLLLMFFIISSLFLSLEIFFFYPLLFILFCNFLYGLCFQYFIACSQASNIQLKYKFFF